MSTAAVTWPAHVLSLLYKGRLDTLVDSQIHTFGDFHSFIRCTRKPSFEATPAILATFKLNSVKMNQHAKCLVI